MTQIIERDCHWGEETLGGVSDEFQVSRLLFPIKILLEYLTFKIMLMITDKNKNLIENKHGACKSQAEKESSEF